MSMNNDVMQDILYMQALQSNESFEVDFAVGTTFSLSMEGLVAVPLALSKLGEPRKMTDHTAIYLMEGIRRASDKFVLFCNKGSIHVPANCQPLYSLLERSVVEVFEEKNPLANFHPKMWVIRETSEKEKDIKVIITSRNLTFSTDLDVAVVIRGKISNGQKNVRNKPLADMLRNLAEHYISDDKRKNKIKRLAQDLEMVDRFDFESPFSEKVYEIHPFLFDSSRYSKTLNESQLKNRLMGKRVLVISPFLDSNANDGFLKDIKEQSDEVYLVTNDNNITDEILNMFHDVYIPNGLIAEDEKVPVHLHAKIYLVEQRNSAVYMYLGSANATINGFTRNSELVMGMRLKKDVLFDDMFNELVLKNGLYVRVSEPIVNLSEELEKRRVEGDMEHIMRWAMNSMDSAKIVKKQKETANPYEVTLLSRSIDSKPYHIDCVLNKYNIYIRPLHNSNDWKSLDFCKLKWYLCLEDLSEFYVVKVTSNAEPEKSKSGICKVATEGLERFVASRNESIVNSIVKADNIMEYIDMILSEFPEYTFESWETHKRQGKTSSAYQHGSWDSFAIYEKLLKASYESPDRIKDLKDVIGKLRSKEYSDDLKSLLTAFGLNFRYKRK